MEQKETKVVVTGRFMGGAIFGPRKEGKPAEVTEGGRYSALVVLDDGEAEKIQQAIDNAKVNQWGADQPSAVTDWGVREGDDVNFENSYGHKFINPKSPRPIQLRAKVNGEVVKVDKDSAVTIYPGCYVRMSVSAYCMPGKPGKYKPTATLQARGMGFLRDGERLGDAFSEDELGDYESESDTNDIDQDLL